MKRWVGTRPGRPGRAPKDLVSAEAQPALPPFRPQAPGPPTCSSSNRGDQYVTWGCRRPAGDSRPLPHTRGRPATWPLRRLAGGGAWRGGPPCLPGTSGCSGLEGSEQPPAGQLPHGGHCACGRSSSGSCRSCLVSSGTSEPSNACLKLPCPAGPSSHKQRDPSAEVHGPSLPQRQPRGPRSHSLGAVPRLEPAPGPSRSPPQRLVIWVRNFEARSPSSQQGLHRRFCSRRAALGWRDGSGSPPRPPPVASPPAPCPGPPPHPAPSLGSPRGRGLPPRTSWASRAQVTAAGRSCG